MEIDMENFIIQLGDMFIDSTIKSLFKTLPESDALFIKKSLDVFTKYGVPKITALNIIVELGNLGNSATKKTTKYVCDHCGKKFDKNFPNIESVMAYHMQTEHADELDDTIELIDNNFTEE